MNFISPEEKTFQLNFEREADFIINDIIDELAYNTEMILAEKEITISDEKTLKIFKSFMDAAQLAISEFLVTMKNFYKKLSQEFYDF